MIGRRFALISVLLLASGGGLIVLTTSTAHTAALHILDVGQGDAILLRSGTVDILIDGGPDTRALRRLGEVRPVWDRRIDVLILSHPQQDHLAGLLPLLARERVGLLLLPEIAASSDLFRGFIEDVLAHGIPVRFASSGQTITARRLRLSILGPSSRTLELAKKNPNNGSVIVRADIGTQFSVLLTGDIERGAEHLLVEEWGDVLDTDVLKVPHHGSKTSSSIRLLRAVSPRLAVVSSGRENRFGHPHESVLARFRTLPLLRTDTHGTVSLMLRDSRVVLVCSRARRCSVKI